MLTIVIGDIHGIAGKLQNFLAKSTGGFDEPRKSDTSWSFSATTSIVAQTRVKSFKSSNASKPRALSAFEAITKSSCLERRNRKGASQTFLSMAVMQPLPLCGRRPHFSERKSGCAASRPITRTNAAIMFTRGFVRCSPRPADGRSQAMDTRQLPSSHEPFPKYVVHGHSPTIYFDPQQKTPDVRDNRCNVDTGAGINGYLSAAIFNDRQTKPIHTISAGAEN